MKTWPPGFEEALKAGSTSAFLYTISCTNGTAKYFTDAAKDINVEGINFSCKGKIKRSALSLSVGLDTDNVDVDFLYSNGFVTKTDIKAGLYRDASFVIEHVIVDNPSIGAVVLLSGLVGEATIRRVQTTYTLHSLSDLVITKAARTTNPSCPWVLGDMTPGRCMKDISSLVVNTSITSVVSDSVFSVAGNFYPAGITAMGLGYMLVTSGVNSGFIGTVKTAVINGSNTDITLWETMPYMVSVSDSVTFYPGCSKLISFCDSNYGNAGNFGGQPYVPGELKTANGT